MPQHGPAENLAAQLRQDESALYVFNSTGVRHFIGESLLIAMAAVLLKSFFEGVEKSLQPRVASWGEKLSTWVADSLEGLFAGTSSEVGDTALDEAIARMTQAAAGKGAAEIRKAVDESKSAIQSAFEARGASRSQAERVVKRIEDVVTNLVPH